MNDAEPNEEFEFNDLMFGGSSDAVVRPSTFSSSSSSYHQDAHTYKEELHEDAAAFLGDSDLTNELVDENGCLRVIDDDAPGDSSALRRAPKDANVDARNGAVPFGHGKRGTQPKLYKQVSRPSKPTSRAHLADFEKLKMLGRGAYGTVYLVRHRTTNHVYAMKVFRKDFLLKTNNVTYTRTERNILRRVRHPFIVSLHFSFQCDHRVYLIMDYMNGGNIFAHLRREKMFDEDWVRFYAAEIVLALQHLHENGIVHRDLKPENILIDGAGHISIADFGLATDDIKGLADPKRKTFCGTLEYMSPEMVKGKGHGMPSDWWSLGILVYDMLTGTPPWRNKSEANLQQMICSCQLRIPPYLGKDASHLIKQLLNRDVTKRLGSGPNGVQKLKKHRFFRSIDWEKLENKETSPPFRPAVPKGAIDVSNHGKEWVNQPVRSLSPGDPLSASQQLQFQGFSYVRSDIRSLVESSPLSQEGPSPAG